MPDNTTPNVKVYDRPERTGPSPVMLAIIVIAVLVVGYFVYRAMRPAAPAASGQYRGSMLVPQVIFAFDAMAGTTTHVLALSGVRQELSRTA